MRMRIVAAVAGAALLLPGAALAQEDDLCHFDPTNPECIEGADDGVDDGADDGIDGADDGIDGADDGIDGADDGIDGADDGIGGADDGIGGADDGVAGAVPAEDVLAVTGTEIGPALGLVAALLAMGSLLLFGVRKRRIQGS